MGRFYIRGAPLGWRAGRRHASRRSGGRRASHHAEPLGPPTPVQPLDAWMVPTETGVRVWVDDTDAVWPIHVDPTTFTAAWTATGATTYTMFGKAVAGATEAYRVHAGLPPTS